MDAAEGAFVNFAICGAGIISSSPCVFEFVEILVVVLILSCRMRSEQRYLDLQRRGEEPDMLVTRSFAQASLFALDDAEEDEGADGHAVDSERA
jgi:hypothetical protein